MENPNHPFSWQALGRIVTTGILVIIAWKALDALVLILISIVLAVSLSPIVRKLNMKLHPILSIVIVFVVLLLPFTLLGAFVIYNLSKEAPSFLLTVNSIANNTPAFTNFFGNLDIMQYLQNASGYILSSTKNIALVIVSIFTVIFLSFYFIYDYKHLLKLFLDLFPQKNRSSTEELLGQLAEVIGKYMRGNIIISLITGIITYAGLLALQIPYALPIAIFTALLDLLPMIGPIIGSIPALILGFAISPTKGLLVLLLYFLYQQVENVFISPLVYNKELDVSPTITFISVVIGGSVFGLLGAFLALPVAASIPVIMKFKDKYIS